jgi:hypothetical protein
MRADRDGASEASWRPFVQLVVIRAAFLVGAALTLVSSLARHDFPPFRGYDARTDLLFGTFEQWDSGWFRRIAQHGYDNPSSAAFPSIRSWCGESGSSSARRSWRLSSCHSSRRGSR